MLLKSRLEKYKLELFYVSIILLALIFLSKAPVQSSLNIFFGFGVGSSLILIGLGVLMIWSGIGIVPGIILVVVGLLVTFGVSLLTTIFGSLGSYTTFFLVFGLFLIIYLERRGKLKLK